MMQVVNRFIQLLKDLLASALLRDERTPAPLSPHTLSLSGGGTCTWLLPYRNHKKLLINLKHGDEVALRAISKPLSRELIKIAKSQHCLLVPLPQSRFRVLSRGFNQSRRVLEQTMRHNNSDKLTLVSKNLVKIKETKKQAKLPRRERLNSQQGAYTTRHPERFAGETIILFDDIVTTGSTLAEARKVLLKAGAKEVICVALAH